MENIVKSQQISIENMLSVFIGLNNNDINNLTNNINIVAIAKENALDFYKNGMTTYLKEVQKQEPWYHEIFIIKQEKILFSLEDRIPQEIIFKSFKMIQEKELLFWVHEKKRFLILAAPLKQVTYEDNSHPWIMVWFDLLEIEKKIMKDSNLFSNTMSFIGVDFFGELFISQKEDVLEEDLRKIHLQMGKNYFKDKVVLSKQIMNSNGYFVSVIPLAEVNAPLKQLIFIVLLTGFIGLLLSTYLFVILTFKLIQNILDLNKTVQKFASGEFLARVPCSSQDEMGQLAFSFNCMADKLNNAYTDLQNHTLNLEKLKLQLERLLFATKSIAMAGSPLSVISRSVIYSLAELEIQSKIKIYILFDDFTALEKEDAGFFFSEFCHKDLNQFKSQSSFFSEIHWNPCDVVSIAQKMSQFQEDIKFSKDSLFYNIRRRNAITQVMVRILFVCEEGFLYEPMAEQFIQALFQNAGINLESYEHSFKEWQQKIIEKEKVIKQEKIMMEEKLKIIGEVSDKLNSPLHTVFNVMESLEISLAKESSPLETTQRLQKLLPLLRQSLESITHIKETLSGYRDIDNNNTEITSLFQKTNR